MQSGDRSPSTSPTSKPTDRWRVFMFESVLKSSHIQWTPSSQSFTSAARSDFTLTHSPSSTAPTRVPYSNHTRSPTTIASCSAFRYAHGRSTVWVNVPSGGAAALQDAHPGPTTRDALPARCCPELKPSPAKRRRRTSRPVERELDELFLEFSPVAGAAAAARCAPHGRRATFIDPVVPSLAKSAAAS